MKRIVFFIIILTFTSGLILSIYGREAVFQPRRCSISQQNFLNGSRYYWENGSIFRRSVVKESLLPDTLRILAILIEFQLDEDLETTGDGLFDLSTSSDFTIDPPPHDQDYFENQLTALSNYYRSVSKKKLILKSDVVPQVFTLPHDMGTYNQGSKEEVLDQGLVELFRDAVVLADSAGVQFSKYDCFLVFHAGVGRDIDLGYDPTPKDIPSVFLNLEDFRKELGGGDEFYQGIEVEGGQYFVKEGIILPETENQEGYEIGLLGTMAIMFGFQIGLPALWDTGTGRSGIGSWGLMDQGSGNYNGLIPAEPCAWSKVFLGWFIPIEISQGTDLEVACSKALNPNKIYKVPINDSEYFLIENRIYDTNSDSVTVGWDNSGTRVIFRPDGQIEAPQPAGVIVRVEEYDYGLPGSGILIWHIDERVIEERFTSNSINAVKDHRGVDLEEADGAKDIGESYGFLEGGAGSESGVLHDAWFADNEINKLVNNSESVSFTPNTYPNSRSNSGANSHIVISDFSEIDTVMTFSVRNDINMTGFPVHFGQDQTPYPPLFGDIDGDGETEIVVVTKEGKIYAWEKDGSSVIQNESKGYRVSVSEDTVWFSVALFADAVSEITTPPIVGDFTGEGQDEIIVATKEGKILGWTGNDENEDGLCDKIVLWDLESHHVTTLVMTRNEIVIGTEEEKVYGMKYPEEIIWQQDLQSGSIAGICQYVNEKERGFVVTTANGEVFLVGAKGEVVWQKTISLGKDLSFPAAGRLSTDQSVSFVMLTQEGKGIIVDGAGMEKARFGEGILSATLSSPAIGDLDKDGFMEIAFSAGGHVWCFNHNGSLTDHFPVPISRRDVLISSPVLGDVDGDLMIEIVVATSRGIVEAYRADGTQVDGFPLSVGGQKAIPPTLLDLDSDGDIEVAAVSEEGSLFVWDLPGAYNSDTVPWGSFLHDPAHTGMNPQHSEPPSPGKDFMPYHLVYNYPNPTKGNFTTIRYRLEHTAQVWIKIFDLAGELVDEFSGPGEKQTENEVVWQLSGVESGVYFCQVRAKGNEEEKVVTFKIAVVK